MKISKKVLVSIIVFFSILILVLAITLPLILIEKEDLSPPILRIENPSDGAILRGIVEINCFVDDNGTALSDLDFELYIDNSLRSTNTSYEWDTTEELDGHHLIEALVSDRSQNVAYQNITVTIDNFIDPPPTDKFKILEYNIQEGGIGNDWKEVVKAENADIIVFVETGTWDDKKDRKLNNVIQQFNAYFYDEAPYEGYAAQDVFYSTSGEAILSRYPILNFTQIYELTLDDNSTYNPTHDFIHAELDIYGTITHVIGYHLKCCSNEYSGNTTIVDNEWRREREQEGIINYMDSLGDVPILYVGDLNSLSPEDTGDLAGVPAADFGYGPATMLLDPNDPVYGNYSSKVHNFTDVYRTLNPTIPGYTLNIPTLTSRIDFIFVNQHFTTTLISSNVGSGTVYDSTAADHFSVDAVIDIANITSYREQQSYSGQTLRYATLRIKISTKHSTIIQNPSISSIEISTIIVLKEKKILSLLL
ncbi:MAG: endonuclease/exonuclease/phosphatase family protein [Candidatus Heimdallarchaeaceae archaeon]